MRHLGGPEGPQRVAQGRRWADDRLNCACAGRARVGVEALRHRGTPVWSQAVDHAGVRGGWRGDGVGGSQSAAPPSREGAQRRARVEDRTCGETPRAGGHAAGASRAPSHLGRRGASSPTATGRAAGPATPGRAPLREEDQGGALCHARKGRPLDPCEALEGGASLTARYVRGCLAARFQGERLAGPCVRPGPAVRLEVLGTHGSRLRRAWRPGDGLRQGTEGRGPPGAWLGCGALVFPVWAGRVAQRGQGERSALPSEEGVEDGPPRDAREVAHALGACAVHRLPGLMPRLTRVCARGQEHLGGRTALRSPQTCAAGRQAAARRPSAGRRGSHGPSSRSG